jgi:hypothetical protein
LKLLKSILGVRHNGFGLGVRWGFPALKPIKGTKAEFTTSAQLLPNRCYLLGGLSALNLI